MKIGVMTFHWATNYGAALQAYALVKHLRQSGHEAEDINYLPKRTMRRLRFFDFYLRRFTNIKRAGKFKSFRKNFLTVSKKTYGCNKDLYKIGTAYDAVITGSDQIWNDSFLTTAEKTPTPSYYLDFVPENVLRISYAASFGINTLTENQLRYGIPELKKFHAVSVREDNAVHLLLQENVPAVTVCDPTLLIEPQDYAPIIAAGCTKKTDVFNFMLRKGRASSDKTDAFITTECFSGKTNLGDGILTVEQWLWKLKNCDLVVTDSFHCTVFAILFHKPFLAVNDKDCSMNARIKTLTQRLGLEHRVVDCFDPEKIRNILTSEDIDWALVDRNRRQWAKESAQFLCEHLKGN